MQASNFKSEYLNGQGTCTPHLADIFRDQLSRNHTMTGLLLEAYNSCACAQASGAYLKVAYTTRCTTAVGNSFCASYTVIEPRGLDKLRSLQLQKSYKVMRYTGSADTYPLFAHPLGMGLVKGWANHQSVTTYFVGEF
eukprot:1083373-Pelagomonas_calceolata.AAC.3